jgi:hypothetical protein
VRAVDVVAARGDGREAVGARVGHGSISAAALVAE